MVNVQFDASAVEAGCDRTIEMLNGLKNISNNICKSIINAFYKVVDSMKAVENRLNSIADALDLMITKMDEIMFLMQNDITTNWLDGFSAVIDSASLMLGTITLGFELGLEVAGPKGAIIGAIIGAIVGLVALIIANWDTIKAFLVSALEWIKTNIIQPAMNLVHKYIVFLQSLIRFVQNLFTAFTEFFRNAFVTDWSEQFGAFGSVLNAFFHNIESIWNAVKRIFDGILGYLKGVFSGDWEAVWESVVEVFIGIWDGHRIRPCNHCFYLYFRHLV